MEDAVKRYRARRQARLDERHETFWLDPVAEYGYRRMRRLEERMDANPKVAYGIAKGMGIDTTGMKPKEVYEAIAKHGGNARGKRPRGNAEYEEKKAERKSPYKQSYKTPGGVRFPKIKDGARWDDSVLKEVSRLAKKGGRSKQFDKVMSSITEKDIVYQKGPDGAVVASIPGLSQMFDSKMVGRSKECKKIYQDKIKKGKQITSDMIEATNGIGCRLMGLENCFKGGSSTSGKIDRKRKSDRAKVKSALEKGEMTQEEADKILSKTDEDYTSGFGDVVRYTVLGKHVDTVATVKNTVKALEEKGYELEELDNKWLPDKDGKPSEYKAVHLTFRSPTGEHFEVQVHSDETMRTKNKNHRLYEEQRDPKTSKARASELGKQMAKNAAALEEPKGIMELESFKKVSKK